MIDFKNTNEEDLSLMFDYNENNLKNNLFIISNNRTLILNNIDYLPVSFQKKLLDYLENKNFYQKFNIELSIKIISII